MRAIIHVGGRTIEQAVVAWDGKRHLTTEDDAGHRHEWLMPSGVHRLTARMRVERIEEEAPVVAVRPDTDRGGW